MTSTPESTSQLILASWPGIGLGNPFIAILADGLAAAGVEMRSIDRPSRGVIDDASALLLQWPDQIFWNNDNSRAHIRNAARELAAIWRWRRAGKTIVWVVHNAVPHDRPRPDRLIWAAYARVLCRLVHGYMTLSPATRDAVMTAHPGLRNKPFASFRHPAYPDVRREDAAAQAVRQHLGLAPGDRLIGMIGMQRAYKGVGQLIEIFDKAAEPRWKLLIAGRPGNATALAEIEALTTTNADVLREVRPLSDDEFALYVAASDRLVAPYRNYLHSGFLVYAASAARMVLTPSTPFARDLAERVGPGWLRLYTPPLTPEILRAFVDSPAPLEPPDLSTLSPDQAGRDIARFVAQLRAGRSRTTT